MFNKIKILFVFLSICSCNLETEDFNTAYDIIIIAGQSNTNQGYGMNSEIDKTDSNIYQLGRYSLYNHVIIPAHEPLQHHTSDDDKIGFGLTFAKLYNKTEKANKNPILIIPCGYGGSSLKKDWQFENFLYQDLIERVKFIQKKYPKSTITTFLWHQGESDVTNSDYQKMLDEFIKQVRIDLNEDIPFILGGMVPYWVNQQESRIHQQNIIKDTPNRISNTSYADPEIPFVIHKTNNTVDEIHYDAQGQRELGKRYFSAYQELIK
ncbi:sialate O-acetylesterase [Wenyingzhuangia sp. chi5]|uniref:Sialate O-acetylesterase n=1 Tax=Wenyingzhuangia gilva TaxID=3057677 RepID=A0ABT8VSX3_9FLAO|nr:sialate O-acetylesterase [Wenyingzhuangia sp. chi5]MDO3695063.1 sialate O-acetylesterase [Wenyingzhuangia sp. chi5]